MSLVPRCNSDKIHISSRLYVLPFNFGTYVIQYICIPSLQAPMDVPVPAVRCVDGWLRGRSDLRRLFRASATPPPSAVFQPAGLFLEHQESKNPHRHRRRIEPNHSLAYATRWSSANPLGHCESGTSIYLIHFLSFIGTLLIMDKVARWCPVVSLVSEVHWSFVIPFFKKQKSKFYFNLYPLVIVRSKRVCVEWSTRPLSTTAE